MLPGFAYTRFADHLASMVELSTADLDYLEKMPFTIGHFSSHHPVRQKGDQADCCCLLLQGYLCWREAGTDVDQIISIYVPGDVPDLSTYASPAASVNLSSLGPVVIAFIPHSFFRDAALLSPAISRALSLLNLADTASLRNWIINLGSRDSLTRVAHLFCEITFRLRAVGLARDFAFASPFTQSDLAAACGISPVHANRIVQVLRRKNLLHWQSKTVTVTDWQGLTDVAQFDPDYLNFREGPPLPPMRPLGPRPAEAAHTGLAAGPHPALGSRPQTVTRWAPPG